MLKSQIYQESVIGVAVDEVHCVTLFVCGIFVTLVCHFNAGRFASSVWNFWQ